jgi:UDP-glucuronate decarboxylase
MDDPARLKTRMGGRRILLSGGDGFLGRALSRRLLARGAHLDVIDDHSTSLRQSSRPQCIVTEADICTTPLDALDPPDLVVHLASPAAPSCFTDRSRVIAPNVRGTERLVELASHCGARLLFASSSEVYGLGTGDARPFREHDAFVDHGHGGRSCYAAAKRLGEEIVVAGRDRGLDATCLRIFNVYGPGMDPTLPGDGRVVANFLHAVRGGQALPIYGDGQQVRSFLWIDDFVDAVEAVLNHPGPLPPVLNVGRDEPVQILELAGALERALGRELPRRLHVRPADGTRWRSPDTSRLRELTGWRAKVSLQAGLRRLLDDPTAPALARPQEAKPCP